MYMYVHFYTDKQRQTVDLYLSSESQTNKNIKNNVLFEKTITRKIALLFVKNYQVGPWSPWAGRVILRTGGPFAQNACRLFVRADVHHLRHGVCKCNADVVCIRITIYLCKCISLRLLRCHCAFVSVDHLQRRKAWAIKIDQSCKIEFLFVLTIEV